MGSEDVKLSAEIVLEHLEKTEKLEYFSSNPTKKVLKYAKFYSDNGGDFEKNTIYIAKAKLLPQKPKVSEDALIICYEGAPPIEYQDGICPIIVLSEAHDAYSIFNTIQEIFRKHDDWENRMDEIAQGSTEIKQMLVDKEGFFKHCLVVLNRNYNYVAYSSTLPLLKSRNKCNSMIREPFYNQDKDYVINLFHNNYFIGTLLLLASEENFSETEIFMANELAEKVKLALEKQSLLIGLGESSFKSYILDYFNDIRVDRDLLNSKVKACGGDIGDLYVCYKVKASDESKEINADYICSIFEAAFDVAVSFWYSQVLVVIVNINRSVSDKEDANKQMDTLIKELDFKAGVSQEFHELSEVKTRFRQACCAFDQGYEVDKSKTLYFFEDYMLSYMMAQCSGEFSVEFLCRHELNLLKQHDLSSNVSYTETLKVYLDTAMNLSKTADILCIHRTSLNVRLQKIKSILNNDLEDSMYRLYLQIILSKC